ncbi:MAG: hypothetical protein R3F62_15455 [Planctomycetota bacterium]
MGAPAEERDDELSAALRLLAERGVRPFPQNGEALDPDGPELEVEWVDSPEPRGAVLDVLRLGFRDAERVLVPARVRCSAGPRDPLAAALQDLVQLLERSAVPQGGPQEALDRQRARLDRGEPLELDALARALAQVDALQDEVLGLTLEDVYRILGGLGVSPHPTPGADHWPAPWGDVQLQDDPSPPGTLLKVQRRGFRHHDQDLLAPEVVLSRGPADPLLPLLSALGSALPELEGATVELRADLTEAASARARAPGDEEARLTHRRARLTVATRLLAVWSKSGRGVDPLFREQVYPALAGFDPEVELFPRLPEPDEPVRVPLKALRDATRYQVEERFADAPRGRVLEVRRFGLRGLGRGFPAQVVVSLGPQPPLERDLDALAERSGGPQLAAAIEALRDAARAYDAASAQDQEPDAQAVARAAVAVLDVAEPRADPALGELLDRLVTEGLAPYGVQGINGTDDALQSTLLRRSYAFDEAPPGTYLGPVTRGLRVGDAVVRPGEDRLSAGPRHPLGKLAESLATEPEEVGGPAGKTLADALGLERAIEADALAGRAALGAGTTLERAVALARALDAARPHSERCARALTGPVAELLEREGVRLYPRLGARPGAALQDEARYAEVQGVSGKGPRGEVLAVLAHGLQGPDHVLVPARVQVALGDAAWDALGDSPPAPLAELGARLRDPREPLDDDALVRALYDAALEGVTPELEAALSTLDAELFPRAGEAWPRGSGDAEVQRVFADAPADTVLAVLRPGLRRGGACVERARLEVSRGPLGPEQRALAELAEGLAGEPAQALEVTVEAWPELDDAARAAALLEHLSRLEDAGLDAAPLGGLLRARGYRVFPEGPGASYDELEAAAGAGAWEPARKVCGDEAPGTVLEVERHAVLDPAGAVLQKGRARVVAGPPSELYQLGAQLEPALRALDPERREKALEELFEVLGRIAEAKAERELLLALPLMNLLQKLELRDAHGRELKDYLREQGVRELIAYPGYDANKLGVSKLEEVRVRSDRARGKIVRVLRPGFLREQDDVVLQKVRAEVSR